MSKSTKSSNKNSICTDHYDITIVLPTYNERENIVKLILELQEVFNEIDAKHQILVIDDSSIDGTAKVVIDKFKNDQNVKLILRKSDKGLAVSIRQGIEQALGDIVLVMDTDFNHKPKDAVLLFQVARFVDLSIGSRFIFGGMSNILRYFELYLQYYDAVQFGDENR